MITNKKDHYEFCATCFQYLDDQIRLIQDQFDKIKFVGGK